MKVADAAEIHHISERTIRRWIEQGRLETRKIDGATHVSPAEMEYVADRWRTRSKARVRLTLT